MFQKSLMGVSMVFQGSFNEVPMVFQESYKEDCRVFRWYFEEVVSNMFQRSFKGIFHEIKGGCKCVKDVSGFLDKVSKLIARNFQGVLCLFRGCFKDILGKF